MRMLSSIYSIICIVLLTNIGFCDTAWEKKAFKELSRTSNALSINEWKELKDWEKKSLYKTKHQPRINPEAAYSLSRKNKTLILSVDQEGYFKRQRILNAMNIPSKNFSDSFIKKNKSKFKKYDLIIVYCR